MKGLSLHIGINKVDSQAYKPMNITELSGCQNDAIDMRSIADKIGYLSTILLTEAATYQNVVNTINWAIKKLEKNDIFLLTYSGHGGQIIDKNGDEKDGLDETWVLYDRQITDDELYSLWSKFVEGVRIVVISDSCHSGTIAKSGLNGSAEKVINNIKNGLADKSLTKCLASGILISSSQDNQVSFDMGKNGLFTSKLLEVWNDGKFKGTYKQFRNSISSKLSRIQSPNYLTFGKSNLRFSRQIPFTI